MALPPRIQRHQHLRYEGLQYTNADIVDFKTKGLSVRMLMEHKDAQRQSVFTSQAWRRLFDIRGPLVYELILEFFSTFRFGEAVIDLDTARALQFHLGGSRRPLLGGVRHLRRYLRLFAAGRKSGANISGGQFVARLAEHFGFLTMEILQGLTVIAHALSVIDMVELVRLQIYEEIDDT
ncbi:hypothetical protein Tco_1494512, partial [Tanacetum coccineum]